MRTGLQALFQTSAGSYSYNETSRAAAFRGRRERSLCLFLVAWEGHQADKKAK